MALSFDFQNRIFWRAFWTASPEPEGVPVKPLQKHMKHFESRFRFSDFSPAVPSGIQRAFPRLRTLVHHLKSSVWAGFESLGV